MFLLKKEDMDETFFAIILIDKLTRLTFRMKNCTFKQKYVNNYRSFKTLMSQLCFSSYLPL